MDATCQFSRSWWPWSLSPSRARWPPSPGTTAATASTPAIAEQEVHRAAPLDHRHRPRTRADQGARSGGGPQSAPELDAGGRHAGPAGSGQEARCATDPGVQQRDPIRRRCSVHGRDTPRGSVRLELGQPSAAPGGRSLRGHLRGPRRGSRPPGRDSCGAGCARMPHPMPTGRLPTPPTRHRPTASQQRSSSQPRSSCARRDRRPRLRRARRRRRRVRSRRRRVHQRRRPALRRWLTALRRRRPVHLRRRRVHPPSPPGPWSARRP